jgi:excisionase family DNA binding protein
VFSLPDWEKIRQWAHDNRGWLKVVAAWAWSLVTWRLKKGPAVIPHKQATETPTELIDAAEVARRLKLKSGTVRVWARAGKIPSIRASRRTLRFRWEEVCRALEAGGRREG